MVATYILLTKSLSLVVAPTLPFPPLSGSEAIFDAGADHCYDRCEPDYASKGQISDDGSAGGEQGEGSRTRSRRRLSGRRSSNRLLP